MRPLPPKLLLIALVAVFACCPPVSMVDVGPLPPQEPVAWLAVAHRGSLHSGKPDNSLSALRETMAAGVTFLEVDVRRSSEGELFLFHDGSLQRSNSHAPRALRGRRVQELSRAERSEVSLGGSEHIPTLAEALDVVQGRPATLQLDFKGESDEPVLQALELAESRHQRQQVLIQLRTYTRVPTVLARYPGTRLLVRVRSMEELNAALAYPIEFVELERWVTPEAIHVAHARGVKVLANVSGTRLDEKSTWDYFRTRGIDTVMTNHADQALAFP